MRFVIVKDRRENPKKCTVLPLRGRPDILLIDSERLEASDLSGLTLLHPEGTPVTSLDESCPILLVDGNWGRARRIYNRIAARYPGMPRISLHGFKTAYPWKRNSPGNTLSSVEALFITTLLSGRPDRSLLDTYYFRESFLVLNGLAPVSAGPVPQQDAIP